MATKAAELVIDVTMSATEAVAGFADVEGAASGMSRAVATAGDTAERTGRSIAISADSADELAGKTGKATGALGALAGGLEAVGLEKYAAGLQVAGVATDFASGASDALNLVMESTILKNIRATASTIAHSVATKTAAAATAVMTAGQWALNAALNANPIGLIVAGVLLLIGGLVLLYTKSSAVRNVIDSVGRVGKAAISGVVTAVSNLVSWVRDRLPGAFNLAKGLVVGYLNVITFPIRTLVTLISSLVSWVRDKLPTAFATLKTKVSGVVEAVLAPFRTLKGLIDDVLDLIAKIKIPKIPDLNPFSRTSGGGTGGTTVIRETPTTQNYFTFNISGALDPASTARQIEDLMYRYLRTTGATA